MGSTILLVALAVALIAIALLFAWQERRSGDEEVVIYSVEDSIDFVMSRLSDRAQAGLKRSDVRRILEWEVRYLQNPDTRDDSAPVVVGGLPAAAFAQDELAKLGHSYDGPDIVEVLDLRAAYLQSIGAVGDPLTADEIAAVEEGPA